MDELIIVQIVHLRLPEVGPTLPAFSFGVYCVVGFCFMTFVFMV
jgi:hypothetical protein